MWGYQLISSKYYLFVYTCCKLVDMIKYFRLILGIRHIRTKSQWNHISILWRLTLYHIFLRRSYRKLSDNLFLGWCRTFLREPSYSFSNISERELSNILSRNERRKKCRIRCDIFCPDNFLEYIHYIVIDLVVGLLSTFSF